MSDLGRTTPDRAAELRRLLGKPADYPADLLPWDLSARLHGALAPLDRYRMLPGGDNRIVDINLDDERVVDAIVGVVQEATRS